MLYYRCFGTGGRSGLLFKRHDLTLTVTGRLVRIDAVCGEERLSKSKIGKPRDGDTIKVESDTENQSDISCFTQHSLVH